MNVARGIGWTLRFSILLTSNTIITSYKPVRKAQAESSSPAPFHCYLTLSLRHCNSFATSSKFHGSLMP